MRDERDDLIEGRNPVIEALRSGRSINRILISKGEKEGSIKSIIAIARDKRIVISWVEKAKLDQMSKTGSHQGVMAFVSPIAYTDLDDILKTARERNEDPFLVILDGITDANNLGAILRTAEGAGVHGVIIPKRRAIGLTSIVAKVSAGAVEYVPVSRVTNISQTIDYLKKNNIWVVGTDSREGSTLFTKTDLTGPLAIVTGSEGSGMGRLVREKCDFIVKIPMKGKIGSLNASVAAALVIYEAVRQRDSAKG